MLDEHLDCMCQKTRSFSLDKPGQLTTEVRLGYSLRHQLSRLELEEWVANFCYFRDHP